jgi:cell wall-associated NlpC family hydrolase
MSEKLTNTGLVKHAKTMLGLPTSYMWGTLARKIDSGTIDWCLKTYPSMYSADRVAYLQRQIGKRYGCDCVGLIKSYYFGGVGSPKYTAKRDYNTNAIYAAAPKKGPISSLPEVPGTCLYMRGHVGIYIGEGWCIECTLGNYGDGVVKTRVAGRGWTNWFYCPFVEYPGSSSLYCIKRRTGTAESIRITN